jgi:hypothetical protein
MTQSDSILQFGPNAYSKPAAALTVLRETVMGRDAFDFAFRTYAQRWKFKRPTPADFFRTMEDASGVDLDWFWRGWFYSTDHVDIAIADVREYRIESLDPEIDFPLDRKENARLEPQPIMQQRNADAGLVTRVERFPELRDLYNDNDQFTVSNQDRNDYQKELESLEDWQRQVLDRALAENPYLYFLDFENIGGVVSPLPLKIYYKNGDNRELMLPAELWRRDANYVTYLLIEPAAIEQVTLDEQHQTADANFANNIFPPQIRASRLELYKRKRNERNLMADMLVKLKNAKDNDSESGSELPLTPQHAISN